MNFFPLLVAVFLCLVSCAEAKSTNNTDSPQPKCPPPRTCPPQPVCTCPITPECLIEDAGTKTRSPTGTRGTETNQTYPETRTRGTRTTRTGTTATRDRTETNQSCPETRTRSRTGTRMTRTHTTAGRDKTETKRTCTKTETSTGKNTPRRCIPRVPPGCPKVTTAPPTTTMATTTGGITTVTSTTGATTTQAHTTEPFNITDATTTEEVITSNTTEPLNVTEITTMGTTTTQGTSTTTQATTAEATTTTASFTTEASTTLDMNTTEPDDFNNTEAITTEATTTEATTTEASTPPPPPITIRPPLNTSFMCTPPIVNETLTRQRELPVSVFQFLVAKNNMLEYYAQEAMAFTKEIAILAKQSNQHLYSSTAAILLGISAHKSGLNVIIAVSFNTTPGNDYSLSSSQIIENIYDHLEQFKVHYHVVNMKLVSMTTDSYIQRPAHGGQVTTVTKSVTVAMSILGVLIMLGLLGAAGLVIVKLIKRYPVSNERLPLLQDRHNKCRGFTLDEWKKTEHLD